MIILVQPAFVIGNNAAICADFRCTSCKQFFSYMSLGNDRESHVTTPPNFCPNCGMAYDCRQVFE